MPLSEESGSFQSMQMYGLPMKNGEKRQLVFAEIKKLIKELHPELHVQPHVSLDSLLDKDLGLDSLGRIELLVRLEKKLEVHLAERVLTTAETPRDILRALEKSRGARTQRAPDERVVTEPVADVDLTRYEPLTLNEVITHHAEFLSDTVHITLDDFNNGEKNISFAELYKGAQEVAGGLQQYGLEQGDTVAIMLPTSTAYFYSFMAVLLIGCVPVPLYPPTRPSQIEEHLRRHTKILDNAQARVLITIDQVRLIGRLLQTQIDSLRAVVTVEDLCENRQSFVPIPCHEGDTAFLQYTSGSTGDPKGVILTHANLLANIRAMGQVTKAGSKDVFVSWLPLYHDMGLIGAWLGSLYFGCRLVVMPPLSFLARPERWLWAIHKYRGTLSASPNFGYEVCCRRIDDAALEGLDLSSWRLAFNGAESISSQTITRFINRFTAYGFRKECYAPVYGLAESSVGLAFPPLNRGPLVDVIKRDLFLRTGQATPTGEQESSLEFVACGQPLPGHQVRIVDSDGRELPDRQQGRLHFKGPSATSGYLRNPKQTKELFVDEWLDSGDLAYIADGDVYITSRVKDIIIRGGRNVYPHEYEEAVGDIDGIRKGCVAVFGSHDRQDGTEKVVVLAESRVVAPDRQAALREKITSIGVNLLGMPPDDVIIASPGSVLKTSSGKVRRAATRELYEKGIIGQKQRPVWLQIIHMSLVSVLPVLRQLYRKVGSYGYAAYCWLLLAVLVVPLTAGLSMIRSADKSWLLAHRCARLLAWLSGTRIDIKGRAHIEKQEHVLLVANHMSYMDALILTASMPVRCSFVAKAELGENRWLRRPLTNLGTIFVKRFDAEQGKEDSKRISQQVGSGQRILFFAEGTLQRMSGLLPFQMGVFVAAVENKTGIVPITIRGTRNKLRCDSWFPRRGPVRVIFSPKIMPTGDDWQAALSLRNAVRGKILSQVGEPDLAGEFSSLAQMDIARPEKE